MKIVIFGGTTEGRELSHRLAEAGAAVTVCVATPYGDEEQGSAPGIETRIGPLSAEEKRTLLQGASLSSSPVTRAIGIAWVRRRAARY